MISLLKKLFVVPGPAESQKAARDTDAPKPEKPALPQSEVEGVEGFVLYVVRSLVDDGEAVRVTTAETERATVITVSCAKRDIGKIIGKNGKTIAAIRALANGAGGRLGKRVNVEVQD